jgi:hypothetical protein
MRGGWTFPLKEGAQLDARQFDGEELDVVADDESFRSSTGFDALAITSRLGQARWHDAKTPRWMKAILKSDVLAPVRPMPKCDTP